VVLDSISPSRFANGLPDATAEAELELDELVVVVVVEEEVIEVATAVMVVEPVATELELIALDVVDEETVPVDNVACSACANTPLGVVVEEGNGESTLDEAESSVAVMSKADVELP